MNISEGVNKVDRRVAVVGLGYVGLPVAVAFGMRGRVIGFDVNVQRVNELHDRIDRTSEVSEEELKGADIVFTADPQRLKEADFIIVTVPTPIDGAKRPVLNPLIKASETIGRNLSRGSIVVYESTVYPGVTEDVCVPVLERESGLKCGVDFKVGYSPERINPGDKERRFAQISKVVSGQDEESLDIIATTYGSVVKAEIHKAPTIKVAEAAKVIENTQRDLNIALMNELSVLFNKLNIDTLEVLKAAGTKWNFLNFMPGLVGGHCIGVDPYYLTHLAESIGYHPQVILAGRRINDGMGSHVAQEAVKCMIRAGKSVSGAKSLVLGLTFKEDCPDLRNTRVIDIVKELKTFGMQVAVHDPLVDPEDAKREYDLDVHREVPDDKFDLIVLAVPHKKYLRMSADDLRAMCNHKTVIADVKGVLDWKKMAIDSELYWRL